MIDPHPHSRDGLAQRFGPRYRWYVLIGAITGCAVLAAWRMGGAPPAAPTAPRRGDNP